MVLFFNNWNLPFLLSGRSRRSNKQMIFFKSKIYRTFLSFCSAICCSESPPPFLVFRKLSVIFGLEKAQYLLIKPICFGWMIKEQLFWLQKSKKYKYVRLMSGALLRKIRAKCLPLGGRCCESLSSFYQFSLVVRKKISEVWHRRLQKYISRNF